MRRIEAISKYLLSSYLPRESVINRPEVGTYTASLDTSRTSVARRDVCASTWRNQINAGPRTVVRSLCLCRLTIEISPRPAQSQLEAANRPSRGRRYLEGRR